MSNQSDIQDFLTSRRARITPGQAGLAVFGTNRRVPGLRREEVAALCDMSVDYYSRLEQSRGPQPSEQMLAAMARGLRLTLDIASRAPLLRHSGGRYLPAVGADDDAALRAHVRAHSETIYHPTSTAAMGASDDAVCDPQLRVRGVAGLRVVDASVLPDVPRGNTNAPVIMVAEKAADLLRAVPAPPRQRSGEDAPDRTRT